MVDTCRSCGAFPNQPHHPLCRVWQDSFKINQYRADIIRLNGELLETEKALVDLWKAFAPPTTKQEQQAAMDRNAAVIQRIIDRKREGE